MMPEEMPTPEKSLKESLCPRLLGVYSQNRLF